MKWLSIAILVMTVFAFSPVKSADAYGAFSFSVGFHNELAPYGAWVNYSNYGQVFRPYAYSGYRPYVDGYWATANAGPVWYGNEAWAPYTYNYGYWIFTPVYGWVWIPGNTYHANYVDWSYGGGYIGWRPQYPAGYYYPGNAYNAWVVIDANNFGYQSYRPYALGYNDVRNLWDRRVFRQRYDNIDNVQLERVVRRPIRRAELREREVQIGDRRTRMLVTQAQEDRIQKHVQQVRRTENVKSFKNDDVVRRNDKSENVMKRKFDDIRSKEKSSKDFDRKQDHRSNDFRKDQDNRNHKEFDTKKFDKNSRDSRKVEKSSHETRKIEKNSHESRKSFSKPSRKEDKRQESPSRSNYSKKSSVRSLESHSKKQPDVKRASYSSRKSDSHKSNLKHSSYSVRKSDSPKADHSSRQMTSKSDHGRKETRTTRTTKTQKRQKPPKQH